MAGNREFLDSLGVTLQVLRLLKGYSQAETARRAGIRPNQVSRYETGQVLPQLEQLSKILDALEVDVLDLVLSMRLLAWMGGVIDEAGKPKALGELGEAAVAEVCRRAFEEIEALRKLSLENVKEAEPCT